MKASEPDFRSSLQGAGLSSFDLKILAIVGMTFNHIGNAFGDALPLWVKVLCIVAGCITFPVMAFLLSEGYRHSRNRIHYGFRLFVCGLLSLVPFCIVADWRALNIMFTLLLCLWIIALYEKMQHRFLFWLFFGLAVLANAAMDWPIAAVPLALCFHAVKNKNTRRRAATAIVWLFGALPMLAACVIPQEAVPVEGLRQIFEYCYTDFGTPWADALPYVLFYFSAPIAAMPLLDRYNGTRGRAVKYLFYLYYPLHLWILALVKLCVFA